MVAARSHLWFDDTALEAAERYASLLPRTAVTSVVRAPDGTPGQCGWLVDRFGVSWQVVPGGLARMMSGADAAGAARAMAAVLTMTKLEIAPIEAACAGG